MLRPRNLSRALAGSAVMHADQHASADANMRSIFGELTRKLPRAQPSIISSKALLTFCTRTMDANSPCLRQVHALVDELKACLPASCGMLLHTAVPRLAGLHAPLLE